MNADQLAAHLRPKIRASMAEVRSGLERLARIPSMSAPGYDAAPVQRTAELTAELFKAVGIDARIVAKPGGTP